MAEPSWKQLAAIPESLVKQAVLRALSVEPPPAGVSDHCELGDIVFWAGESGLIVQVLSRGSTLFMEPREALRAHKLSKGTPSGDLARWWLQAKNLLPTAPS